MSVVIVGGHDRMISKYRDICKEYKCKAKVFTQYERNLKSKIGSPDLMVIFTNTVSHKMTVSAIQEASKNNTLIERCHSSSSCALKKILDCHCC